MPTSRYIETEVQDGSISSAVHSRMVSTSFLKHRMERHFVCSIAIVIVKSLGVEGQARSNIKSMTQGHVIEANNVNLDWFFVK